MYPPDPSKSARLCFIAVAVAVAVVVVVAVALVVVVVVAVVVADAVAVAVVVIVAVSFRIRTATASAEFTSRSAQPVKDSAHQRLRADASTDTLGRDHLPYPDVQSVRPTA